MQAFILLGTSACHLCEQADVLLIALNIDYQKIDIAEEEYWQADYAVKIPVFMHTKTQQALCWPFDSEQISLFVKKQTS